MKHYFNGYLNARENQWNPKVGEQYIASEGPIEHEIQDVINADDEDLKGYKTFWNQLTSDLPPRPDLGVRAKIDLFEFSSFHRVNCKM